MGGGAGRAFLESSAVASVKLVEVARINGLIHLINDGKVDEAKAELSFQLASDLSDIHSLLPSVNESTRSLFPGGLRQSFCRRKRRTRNIIWAARRRHRLARRRYGKPLAAMGLKL